MRLKFKTRKHQGYSFGHCLTRTSNLTRASLNKYNWNNFTIRPSKGCQKSTYLHSIKFRMKEAREKWLWIYCLPKRCLNPNVHLYFRTIHICSAVHTLKNIRCLAFRVVDTYLAGEKTQPFWIRSSKIYFSWKSLPTWG